MGIEFVLPSHIPTFIVRYGLPYGHERHEQEADAVAAARRIAAEMESKGTSVVHNCGNGFPHGCGYVNIHNLRDGWKSVEF